MIIEIHHRNAKQVTWFATSMCLYLSFTLRKQHHIHYPSLAKHKVPAHNMESIFYLVWLIFYLRWVMDMTVVFRTGLSGWLCGLQSRLTFSAHKVSKDLEGHWWLQRSCVLVRDWSVILARFGLVKGHFLQIHHVTVAQHDKGAS